MSSSKKFTCKWALLQAFYPSEVHSPPMSPYPPPLLHTVYVYSIYSILVHTWKGGRGES